MGSFTPPVFVARFNYFFFTIILLLQYFKNGIAIKCFVCDSSDNPSCADLKSNTSIVSEECSLDKTKSINSWLFDLNQFAYFETDASKTPLMNCQKVVTRDRYSNKMVTARFCQLDTGDSDACEILHSKLRSEYVQYPQNTFYERRGKQGQALAGTGSDDPADGEEPFHCSICKTDCCNGGGRMKTSMALALSGVITLIAWTYLRREMRLC